ncbi:hypothetical protein [Pseudoclavibacter helvolus]|uniref:Uncharacterized protein n=1 Tax=Pseudoclavibacter helvolus TaxID=255205 RepID=A0A7W4YFC8_9MICO|nr:hypothetical protein [Pseudoclavibacter helvolus]MBB2958474.1 hypothetical protein [Pseudoclavibacter helvolus]
MRLPFSQPLALDASSLHSLLALPVESPAVHVFPSSLDLMVTGAVVSIAVLFVVAVWAAAAMRLRAGSRLPLDLVGRVERAQRINRTATISTLFASAAMIVLLVVWVVVSLLWLS